MIKFIIGKAGTAKTTNLMKVAHNLNNFVALAFTHSAVNNMYKTYLRLAKNNGVSDANGVNDANVKKHFKTLHSYFRINENNQIFPPSILEDNILIDEFSLIPIIILTQIFNKCDTNFILTGDLLQLSPITENSSINVQAFNDSNIENLNLKNALRIAEHLSNTIYVLPEYKKSNKLILTKNFRAGDNVMNILTNALNNKIELIRQDDIKNFVNDGYVVIASKYSILKKVYKLVYSNENLTLNTQIGKIHIKENMKLILTENLNKNLLNGDKLTVVEPEMVTVNHKLTNENFMLINKNGVYPVLPVNFITVHKSQGKGYKKILVILDELFSITMLYTAITRAKEDVKFYIFDEKFMNVIYDMNKAFLKLEELIYG